MSSEGTNNIEKRLADRRDRIFKMMGEISDRTEANFANSIKQKMSEFERMSEDAIKSNDPINATIYQSVADHIYFYMYRNKVEKYLHKYKEQSDPA